MSTNSIILTKEQQKDMERVALYYQKLFNFYKNVKLRRGEKIFPGRMGKEFSPNADKRLYSAISSHLLERKEYLNTNLKVVNPFFIFRLKEVSIINKQFYFNNICLDLNLEDLPELALVGEGFKIIVDIKFSLFKNKLSYSIDLDQGFKIVELRRNNHHYYNYWDYVSDFQLLTMAQKTLINGQAYSFVDCQFAINGVVLGTGFEGLPVKLPIDSSLPGYKIGKNSDK